MATSLPLKVEGSSAGLYESALSTLQQKEHFLPKDLEDVKMNSGVRICLCPKLSVNAPAAEMSHALQVIKRALSSWLVSEGFLRGGILHCCGMRAQERRGNIDLRFELERVRHEIFTPAIFSDENYFNGMAMPLNNAILEADPAILGLSDLFAGCCSKATRISLTQMILDL